MSFYSNSSSFFTSSISARFLFVWEEPLSKKADFPFSAKAKLNTNLTYYWMLHTSLRPQQIQVSYQQSCVDFILISYFFLAELWWSCFKLQQNLLYTKHHIPIFCQDGTNLFHLAKILEVLSFISHNSKSLPQLIHRFEELQKL